MTRSRFSSPAMVTSNRGMFGPLFVFFENNHAAQIRRSVRIKSLLQSSVETHQLTREHIRRQARIFRQIRFQLDSEIGRCLRAAFDSVGDHQSDSPESFDFLKHSSLPLITCLANPHGYQTPPPADQLAPLPASRP